MSRVVATAREPSRLLVCIFSAALLIGLSACGSDQDLTKGVDSETPFVGQAVSIQPDGAILVAGVAGRPRSQSKHCQGSFALLRLKSDGSLDSSFGKDGTAARSVGDDRCVLKAGGVGVQENGEITVAAEVQKVSQVFIETEFTNYPGYLRLKPNGELERDFAEDGLLIGGAGVPATLVLLPDGSIFGGLGHLHKPDGDEDSDFAGEEDNTPQVDIGEQAAIAKTARGFAALYTKLGREGEGAAYLVCLDQKGKLIRDQRRPNGYLEIPLQVAELFNGGDSYLMHSLNGSSLLVAGPLNRLKPSSLVKVGVDGAIDAAFGSQGTAQMRKGTLDFAIGPDGQVVTVGVESEANAPYQGTVSVTRLKSTGQQDLSFGKNGVFSLKLEPTGSFRVALAPQHDGRTVVVASGGPGTETTVFRLTKSGSLDRSFGEGGKVRLPARPFHLK